MKDNEEMKFVCPFEECGRPYVYKKGLARHLKTCHSQEIAKPGWNDILKPRKSKKGNPSSPSQPPQAHLSSAPRASQAHTPTPDLYQPVSPTEASEPGVHPPGFAAPFSAQLVSPGFPFSAVYPPRNPFPY